MNTKYNLNFEKSMLDNSEINENSWFTGFTDSDGHFGIKIREARSKSITRKRSRSFSITLVFKLDQRSFDRATSSSMLSIMEKISKFLFCNLITIKRKLKFPCKLKTVDLFSVEVSALEKIEILINYFNKYPLLGIKQLDYKDWELVYHMIKNKEHLTESGKIKIKFINSNMNSKRLV
jgi:hypothetical protein